MESDETYDGLRLRQQALSQMDEAHCGGCGKYALCQQVEQQDARFPRQMWLCGRCRALPGEMPGTRLWS